MKNLRHLLFFVVICIVNVEIWMETTTNSTTKTREVSDIEDDEEDEFVQIYGNDVNTSGIWEVVRVYAEDRDRLENISMQVHRVSKMAEPKDEISAAIFDVRTLLFTHGGYKDIKMDVIQYAIQRAPQSYIYVGKGMKPGCVHLLIKVDSKALYFFLGKHICNITL